MARFKPIHNGLKLLPVDFDRQIIPGSFEYALCHLVDHELDLSAFHAVIGSIAAYRDVDTIITADAGYHSHANLKTLEAR